MKKDSFSDDAILRFADNFDVVLSALQDIAEDAEMDAKPKTKAMSLINAISSSSFAFSLAAAKKVMSLTLTLSRRLQSPKLDLSDGSAMAAMAESDIKRNASRIGTLMTVHGMVPNSVSLLKRQYFADIAGVQLVKRRITGRQLHRVSQADSGEIDSDYLKRSIWLPYLDTVIVEMKDRFGKMSQMASLLTSVLMSYNVQMENLKKVYTFNGKFIETHEEVLYEELLDYIEYKKKSWQPFI